MSFSGVQGLLHDPQFNELKKLIIGRTGLVYFQDKDADLIHRLLKRFEAVGVASCGSYLALLDRDAGANSEFDLLTSELVIGETYFLRHVEQFDALRSKIIPDLIQKNRESRRLHVWCAGCSIGAEPYSLATLLMDEFATELVGWDVKITGTDINREFLTRAEAGRFEEWSFRTTDADFRSRHFIQDGKSWVIHPRIKNLVEFRFHNLMTSNALMFGIGALDLILCRNVMIYFDQPTVEKIIPNFELALSDKGWLVIGHAEQPHGATRLKLVQLPKVTVYQKSDSQIDNFSLPFSFVPPVFEPTVIHQPISIAPAYRAIPHSVARAVPSTADLNGAISYLRKLADAGQFELALKQCSDLISMDAANAVIYFYQALVLQQMGRMREVEANLKFAIQLDPKFIMAHYSLALFYEGNRERSRAANEFKIACDLLKAFHGDALLPEANEISVSELLKVVSARLKVA